jgi:hypothetical protein
VLFGALVVAFRLLLYFVINYLIRPLVVIVINRLPDPSSLVLSRPVDQPLFHDVTFSRARAYAYILLLAHSHLVDINQYLFCLLN